MKGLELSQSRTTQFGRRTVLAAGVISLAAALAGCGFTVRRASDPIRSTDGKIVDSAEFSTLDKQGIVTALNSKSLRLDFRKGFIAKSDVGLHDSDYASDVMADQSKGEKFRLTIKGTAGTLEAETDHVRFLTTDSIPTLETVTYFLSTESVDEYVQLLRDAVQDYGLSPEPVERWIEATRNNPGRKSDYSLNVGSNLGFDVGYELSYDGSKNVQVIIVSVSTLDHVIG